MGNEEAEYEVGQCYNLWLILKFIVLAVENITQARVEREKGRKKNLIWVRILTISQLTRGLIPREEIQCPGK